MSDLHTTAQSASAIETPFAIAPRGAKTAVINSLKAYQQERSNQKARIPLEDIIPLLTVALKEFDPGKNFVTEDRECGTTISFELSGQRFVTSATALNRYAGITE